MQFLAIVSLIILNIHIIMAMPIESNDVQSQPFHKRSKAGAAGLAATAVVGAASLGTAAWTEHKYMQRTGNPVPSSVHHVDSRTSRERRERRKTVVFEYRA